MLATSVSHKNTNNCRLQSTTVSESRGNPERDTGAAEKQQDSCLIYDYKQFPFQQ